MNCPACQHLGNCLIDGIIISSYTEVGVTAEVVLGQFEFDSGSQQKADIAKTDYSDSLLMITKLKRG